MEEPPGKGIDGLQQTSRRTRPKEAIPMIRPYRTRTDNAEIIRLIRSELIPLSHTISQRDAVTVRELTERLEKGTVFVAASGKSAPPQGFIHVLVLGDALQIDMLAVHPKLRGRHLGVKLMKQGEAHGLSQKCRYVRLYVDEGNERAHRFYARLGYNTVNYHHSVRCFELNKPLVDESFF
jgi:ribosomal protein S18 acetylase RimI-like enzyme